MFLHWQWILFRNFIHILFACCTGVLPIPVIRGVNSNPNSNCGSPNPLMYKPLPLKWQKLISVLQSVWYIHGTAVLLTLRSLCHCCSLWAVLISCNRCKLPILITWQCAAVEYRVAHVFLNLLCRGYHKFVLFACGLVSASWLCHGCYTKAE